MDAERFQLTLESLGFFGGRSGERNLAGSVGQRPGGAYRAVRAPYQLYGGVAVSWSNAPPANFDAMSSSCP
jgi:hypothetical protein